MAKPIKNTPVLLGKDAANFIKNIEAQKNKVAEKSKLEQILSDYSFIKGTIVQ